MEIYQWLFRKNGFKVSNTAYFVYCNAKTNVDKFDNCLSFVAALISYEGDAAWVDDAVIKAYNCLQAPIIPFSGQDCELCKYVKSRFAVPSKNLMNKR